MSTKRASSLKHTLDTSVHLFLFDEFPALKLVDSNLHLPFEPLIVGEQARNGFLDQLVRWTSGPCGQIVELRLLILGKFTSIA